MTDENYTESRVTLWTSADLKSQIEAELGYQDSMSAWMRRAARDRLLIDAELEREQIDIPEESREREQLLRRLLTAGIDATADERK